MDFLILVLLVGGAGAGGYYWGTIQRLAPVKAVPPGTPGAQPANTATSSPAPAAASTPPATTPAANPTNPAATPAAANPSTPAPATTTSDPAPAKTDKSKYWICSSGNSYIGYSITVSVNGTPVDSFFGPGKTIDITSYVKPGENDVAFEAKALGSGYNKHKGDAKAELILQVVAGPLIQENFKKSDVLVTYKRNASETQSFNDTEHFVKD